MAATSTNLVRGDMGAFYASIDNIALDASYPTGGYAVPASVGIGANFGKILGMAWMGGNSAAQPYDLTYNQQTGKIQLYWTGPATSGVYGEVAAGTSLSTLTATVLTVGY